MGTQVLLRDRTKSQEHARDLPTCGKADARCCTAPALSHETGEERISRNRGSSLYVGLLPCVEGRTCTGGQGSSVALASGVGGRPLVLQLSSATKQQMPNSLKREEKELTHFRRVLYISAFVSVNSSPISNPHPKPFQS
jgi:hypothetical protein